MNITHTNPYRSTRLPVFARNVVATSHPLAVQAGLRVMQQGGNAVDAAVAVAAVMTVVEPVSNGLGSDAFCILWDGQSLHGLNAAGAAPHLEHALRRKDAYGLAQRDAAYAEALCKLVFVGKLVALCKKLFGGDHVENFVRRAFRKAFQLFHMRSPCQNIFI